MHLHSSCLRNDEANLKDQVDGQGEQINITHSASGGYQRTTTRVINYFAMIHDLRRLEGVSRNGLSADAAIVSRHVIRLEGRD